MSCWCEEMSRLPVKMVAHFPGGETVTISDPTACPSCHRDLRLPVARVYDGVTPDCVSSGQRWFVWDEGCEIWALDQVFENIIGTFTLNDEGDLISERRVYGPVTVSPAEPEEVPE